MYVCGQGVWRVNIHIPGSYGCNRGMFHCQKQVQKDPGFISSLLCGFSVLIEKSLFTWANKDLVLGTI